MTDPVALAFDDRGDGRPVVLLHGGAGDRNDLAGLRERLLAGRRIVSPEQRGHGRTPFAEPFTYAAMAADTAALLERLALGPADLVGWSDGAKVGLLVARDHPHLVRRVVVIGMTVDSADAPARQTPEASEWLASATADDLPKADGFAGSATEWRPIAARLLELWRAPAGFTLDDLGAVAAPILLVFGDRDLFPLDDVLAMRDAAGADLAVVPATDHRLPQAEPALVAQLVERFLAP